MLTTPPLLRGPRRSRWRRSSRTSRRAGPPMLPSRHGMDHRDDPRRPERQPPDGQQIAAILERVPKRPQDGSVVILAGGGETLEVQGEPGGAAARRGQRGAPGEPSAQPGNVWWSFWGDTLSGDLLYNRSDGSLQ